MVISQIVLPKSFASSEQEFADSPGRSQLPGSVVGMDTGTKIPRQLFFHHSITGWQRGQITQIGVSGHEVMETTVSEAGAVTACPFQILPNIAGSELRDVSHKSSPAAPAASPRNCSVPGPGHPPVERNGLRNRIGSLRLHQQIQLRI